MGGSWRNEGLHSVPVKYCDFTAGFSVFSTSGNAREGGKIILFLNKRQFAVSQLVLFLSLLATNCSFWSNNCFSWHVFLDQWKRTQHNIVLSSLTVQAVSAMDYEFTDRKCQITIFVHSRIIDLWFFSDEDVFFHQTDTHMCFWEIYIYLFFMR